MRSERNQLSKTLAEANDEINELKHKLKIKSYQGQQLKEDIQTKDNLLVKDEFSECRVPESQAFSISKKEITAQAVRKDDSGERL